MNVLYILDIFKQAKSKSDVCRLMGWHINGTGLRKVNQLIKELNPDMSHFDNWKHGEGSRRYRHICFEHFDHVCIIPGCGWDIVVDVHHVDGNHENNSPENLVPLCPNHHKLIHMNEGEEIREIVKDLLTRTFLGVK